MMISYIVDIYREREAEVPGTILEMLLHKIGKLNFYKNLQINKNTKIKK